MINEINNGEFYHYLFYLPAHDFGSKNISAVFDIEGRQDSKLLFSKLVHKEKVYSDWFTVRVVQISLKRSIRWTTHNGID